MRAKALLLLSLAAAPSACVTVAYQTPTYTLVTIPAVGAPVYTASGTPGVMATPVLAPQNGSAMVAVPVVAASSATPSASVTPSAVAPTPLVPAAGANMAPSMPAGPAAVPLYAAPAAAPVIVTPVVGAAGIVAPPVYYVR